MQCMIQELFSGKERTGPSTLMSSDGAAVLGSILTGESFTIAGLAAIGRDSSAHGLEE